MPAYRLFCSVLGAVIFASIASGDPQVSPVGASAIGFFSGLFAAVLSEKIWQWLFLPADEKKAAAKDMAKAVGIITTAFIAQAIITLMLLGGIGLLLVTLLGW